MQYHLNGFRPGDPAQAEPRRATQDDTQVDVAIVGCGPAGLTLAAQLSAITGIHVAAFDARTGPLVVGQADGIACRSMEMFEAFGFADRVQREAYWVNETVFWRPTADGGSIQRADRIQDVADDLSHQPHTILSQARVHDFLLDVMANSASRLTPHYGHTLVDVTRDDNHAYPVEATFERAGDRGGTHRVRARYLVGCDGARSAVRRAIGHPLKGESARQLWGVMDVLAVTDFPDIRFKCAVQSAEHGSLLIIPREGGYLARLYIELDTLNGDERASDRAVTADELTRKARAILAPYTFDVKSVAWCSAYEVGQRVCDQFDDVSIGQRGHQSPRRFIAGDACHTHSPKAGQGMNVSMADAFNLGWKLAAVIRGEADTHLLDSYTAERQAKARELIDFDRDMARLFSSGSRSASDAATFQRYFQQHGRYTAGVETQYGPSPIVGTAAHQSLATGLTVGKRFHSAPVVRLADARPMQLSEVLLADGRWRLIAFAAAQDNGSAQGAVAHLCAWVSTVLSPKYNARHGTDPDSRFDVRAVFQQPHRALDIQSLPPLLRPNKGTFGLVDYEKAYCASERPGEDIFDRRGIDRQHGATVVVRPDHYVAQVLPLTDTDAVLTFFRGFSL